MKLSEAIREGATLRPQAFGNYFTKRKGQICSCAIGAAYEVLCGELPLPDTLHRVSDVVIGLIDEKPNILVTMPDAEAHDVLPQLFVIEAVYTLNDDYKMSREDIADWLERQGF